MDPTASPQVVVQAPVIQPPQPKKNYIFIAVGIVVLLIVTFAGVDVWILSQSAHTKKLASVKTTQQNIAVVSPTISQAISQISDIHQQGLYINSKLGISFSYPPSWNVEDKTYDVQHNSLNLDIDSSGSSDTPVSSAAGVIINITKDTQVHSVDLQKLLGQYDQKIKPETKTYGKLTGQLLSETSGYTNDYLASFIAVQHGIRYSFTLVTPFSKKNELQTAFEQIISSVNPAVSSLPAYFIDNFYFDEHVAAPTFYPARFSLLYEEQRGENEMMWRFVLGLTDTGNGPGDLNVYVRKIGSYNGPQGAGYTVTLDNELKEKSKFVTPNGSDEIVPIAVKNYKGYYVGTKDGMYDSSIDHYTSQPVTSRFGNVIVATDKNIVTVESGSFANVSKSELLKIAESMIH